MERQGFNFIHSHNALIIDSKYVSLQVSDFGLTKFRQELKEKAKDSLAHHGTIHWTAPEVLNDSDGIDYMLADVYSFGIILWELHTRREPYSGLRYFSYHVACSSNYFLSNEVI